MFHRLIHYQGAYPHYLISTPLLLTKIWGEIHVFLEMPLSLADVANDEKLLEKLTHDILNAACDLFAVRVEWLEGVDDRVYETHNFYNRPEEYAEFFARLIADDKHRIVAKLELSTNPALEQDALLVLQEQISEIGNESVYRYHLCGGWVNKHWKSRADLTACIAMTLKQGVYIKAHRTPARIDSFCAGEGFMVDLFNLPHAFERSWLFRRRFKPWHPDQWIFDPESYLDGVDEGAFGKTSALDRWLYYFDKGYLETGYHRQNARAEFAAVLEKYRLAHRSG